MKRLLIVWVVMAGVFGVMNPVFAGYVVRNQQIVPSQGGRSLSNDELAQVIMSTHEDVDRLQSEVSQLKNENQRLRKSIEELEATLTQFKNMYFRRF
ncbi:hypothetical protein EB093_01595 [bacterium]|nr:hypothetical protein [bacterium]